MAAGNERVGQLMGEQADVEEDRADRCNGPVREGAVAWSIDGKVEYALDGGVFAAGAMLEWMCNQLGIAPSPPELSKLAREAQSSAGARVLPGLAGIGAPWWRPARGRRRAACRRTGRRG